MHTDTHTHNACLLCLGPSVKVQHPSSCVPSPSSSSSSQTGSSVWPTSSLPSPFPPLSEGEGYLDEGTCFGEVLLSLVDCSEETRGEITESVCRAAADRAVIPNGYLDPTEVPKGQWASWDPALDRDWEEFIDNLQTARSKDDRIPELSKRSGPRVASLCCLWHYPTYRTDRNLYGTTLDSTNDCIKKPSLCASLWYAERIQHTLYAMNAWHKPSTNVH
ncbi:hypothetical protein Trihar35433_4198 [Trichoderma harzianum]|nr:hypothetical protein Trihar35433_4198 [Trichoderma harzianum]